MPAADLSPEEDVPGSAVVIRFKPTTPEAVLRRAQAAHADAGTEEDPRYHSSVYVDREADDPDDPEVIAGLLAAASLSGIQPPPGNKFYLVTKAQAILDQGFQFKKDRYTGEHENHYSVALGVAPTLDDATRFVEAFNSEGGKKPWPQS